MTTRIDAATPRQATDRNLLALLHGRPAPGVPKWAVWVAFATSMTTLPSGIWRIAGVALGLPLAEVSSTSTSISSGSVQELWWYVIILSVVSEALAYLAFGLVCTWGEVVPRWIPGVGGRRVPPMAAVIPAGLGATVLTLLFPYALIMLSLGKNIRGAPTDLVTPGWEAIVFAVAYVPLAFWGPLLGVLTVHYYRRRRGSRPAVIPSEA